MKIVCVGDCGIDEYPATGDRLPGGITLNFALQARSAFPADDEITVVSALGTDPAAALVRNALKMGGVTHDLSTLDGKTPVQQIALEANGERRFTGYEVGVLRRFRPSSAQRALIEQADWLVTSHFVQVAELFDALLNLPRRGSLAVDFADFREHPDFALLERTLGRIDVAFFGLHPKDQEIVAGLERAAAAYDALLVVTLGAAGSRASQRERRFEQAAVPVPAVVDTTGAGDAFAAGFMSRHCHGASPQACLEAGASRAAAVIQHLGTHHHTGQTSANC